MDWKNECKYRFRGQCIHCYGNWDVLRPAQVIEGMDLISEEILKKLNDEAQDLIEKMRCAV